MTTDRPADGCALLLTAAGTATAYGIAASIRDHWGGRVRLITADTNDPRLVAASALADLALSSPAVDDPAYPDWLVHQLDAYDVAVYWPVLDEEIGLSARLRSAGTLPSTVTAVGPEPAAADTCLDKLMAARWLGQEGLPTPATCLPGEWPPQVPGPMVLKPRKGRGSVGFRLLASAEQLQEFAARDDLIAQERCTQPEVTLDAFRSRTSSASRVICRERLEVKSGVCTKARVFEDPTLARLALTIGDRLGLTGAYCAQMMRGWNGSWVFTDINPRPGAGSRMSAAAGVDTVAAAFADLMNADPQPFLKDLSSDVCVVRAYREWVL